MFSGSLVAIATPMRADGSLDFPAWERLLDFHLENGTSGIVVGGTTGESATLTDAELEDLTRRACLRATGRARIVVGAGSSSTAATAERARRLSGLPVDALLVVTPAYNKPTQEGLYRHFAAVAEAARVPIIAYNVPSRTAVDMLPATTIRLSREVAGVAAIKEAVPKIERIRELKAGCRAGFDILSGDDGTATQAVLAGAVGVVSVTANVAPRAMADLMAAAAQGDRQRAEALDAALAPLHRAMFLETNPIPVKWALTRMGLIGSGIRLPLTPLSDAHHDALVAVLRGAGALA